MEFADVEPDREVLEGALSKELGVDVYELSAPQLGDRSLWLRSQRDRLDVALAVTDGEFERSRAYVKLDPACTKASQWLAAQLGVPVAVARDAYRSARRLRLLPLLTQAVVAGVITGWHALRVAGACANVVRLRRMVEDQEFFIERAGELTGKEFDSALRHWTEVHFGEEIARKAAAADEGRHAHFSRTFDGHVVFSGGLDAVHGTEVLSAHRRIERELFAVDWKRAKDVHGDATRVEHLPRTAAQRRADAMVVMARRSEAARPNASARRPLVSVLVDFETLHGRVCELEDGTHISIDQALELVRRADIERAVWQSADRVAVSEKARLFSGAERRAVELRDRYCTADGCEVPAEFTEVDHIVRYEDGGPTRQDNGWLRCPDDHEGRRASGAERHLPWEHIEDQWDDLEPVEFDGLQDPLFDEPRNHDTEHDSGDG